MSTRSMQDNLRQTIYLLGGNRGTSNHILQQFDLWNVYLFAEHRTPDQGSSDWSADTWNGILRQVYVCNILVVRWVSSGNSIWLFSEQADLYLWVQVHFPFTWFSLFLRVNLRLGDQDATHENINKKQTFNWILSIFGTH